MATIINIIFATIYILDFFIGNLLNGFIVQVNFINWVQKRRVSPVDQIITVLTISRVSKLWLIQIHMSFSLIHSVKVSDIVIRVTNIAWVVTNHFNIWLSTKVSIFYLLKIVNFSNSIFLYLKWRIRHVVSITLILSLVLLVLNIIVINTHIDVWIELNATIMPYNFSSRNSMSFLKQLLFTNSIFASIPFAWSLLAFFLLIFSLWKHEKKMHHNISGSRDSTTKAHIKALKTGLAFLSLYAIFLLSLVINVCSIELQENYIIFLFSLFTGIAFSSCHSYILILGNTKLRQASLSVLWWLRCRPKDVSFSGS